MVVLTESTLDDVELSSDDSDVEVSIYFDLYIIYKNYLMCVLTFSLNHDNLST